MPIEQWWQDLRLAGRGLARARGFTAAAVLTLTIGIAGTTGMFALVQGVLLRPLPVRDQARLLVVWQELPAAPASHWPFLPAEIDTLGRSSRLLESVAGVDYNGVSPTASASSDADDDGLTDSVGQPSVSQSPVSKPPVSTPPVSQHPISQLGVTGHFFDVLGVPPLLGRVLTPADDVTGKEDVIVISHGLWQRRYGGAADVIGRTLRLQERAFRIVGVMPAAFEYPRGAEAWISIAATKAMTDPRFAWGVSVDLIARRRPQVTLEQATGELRTMLTQLDAARPASSPRGLTPSVHTFEDVVVGDVRKPLLVLFAAVSLVLLIASANVANLLLMRGEARRTELAVRAALGASRGRLARQLIAESLLLAIPAGAAGLALTWWTLRPLIASVPGGLPRLDAVRVDAGVIAFAIAVAGLSAVVAGLAPILSVGQLFRRAALASQLRAAGRSTMTPAGRRGRRLLVVAQVALAVTVVAAAGLLTRSLLRLQGVDLGLAADRLVFVQLDFPQTKYTDQTRHFQFLDAIDAHLAATPGISAATTVNTRPYAGTGGWDVQTFTAEGQSAERATANPSLNLEGIEPGYFETLDVPIVRGRAFTDRDRPGATPVAIVSEDVASRIWPGADPIGQRLKFGGPTSRDAWRTIVGVARSTRYRELARPRPTLYLPARQFETPGSTLVLRTTVPLASVAALTREAVRTLDPGVRVLSVVPFTALLAEPLARPRFNAFLIVAFGVVAWLLAAIGLSAVMAAFVRQRDAEIGLRVALGATASEVRRLVVGEGLRLASVGAVIGLATAMASSRLLRGLLFDVEPLDPPALLIAALLLLGAAALACYWPARRAVRVDPVSLLRAA